MRRAVAAALAVTLVVFGAGGTAFAQRSRSRGSVSAASHSGGAAASRGTYSRSGNTGTYQGQRASGSRTVTQSGDTYNISKQVETQSGASKSVSREIDTDDREVERSSTTTNAWGQSASRSREVENEGGASIEGSASTSTGRSASGEFVAGRNVYGQPAYAGSVNTKYYGSYATAGARNPYGGWTTATVGPYGGKVTTTLPAGYRTCTYHGRPYYAYGGTYYRPYTYAGVHYYYPVPVPYYAYYETPPVGATILMLAGVKYLVSKDGSYSKEATNSQGKIVYQSVPAPQGAALQVLPASRVLVTVTGTTYFLASNAFYRRVAEGGQERFVTVTAPAGVVIVGALPANFEVVQLNTMYFRAQGRYFVPYLSPDGKEQYVMVDAPPQPPAGGIAPPPAPGPGTAVTSPPGAQSPAGATAPGSSAAAVRTAAESLVVPAGTLVVTRFQADVSAATASPGDRLQGFLDQDVATNGRLVATRGSRAYGIVSSIDRHRTTLVLELTDLKVGDRIVPIKTQAASVGGGIRAQSPQPFTLAAPVQVDLVTNVAVR